MGEPEDSERKILEILVNILVKRSSKKRWVKETLSASHSCLLLASRLWMGMRKLVLFLPHSSMWPLLPRRGAGISTVYNVLRGHIIHPVGSRCTAGWDPCPSCPFYSSEWHYLQLQGHSSQRPREIPDSSLSSAASTITHHCLVDSTFIYLKKITEYQLCAGMGLGYKDDWGRILVPKPVLVATAFVVAPAMAISFGTVP